MISNQSRSSLTDEQWQEATRRLRAAGEAVRARFPKFCPHCSDDSDLAPTFDGEVWMCGACCQPFEVTP